MEGALIILIVNGLRCAAITVHHFNGSSTITAKSNVSLSMFFHDSYMNGLIQFTIDGTVVEQFEKVDSSIDLNTYHSFLVKGESNVTCAYYPDQRSLEWMEINDIVVFADIGDQRCPSATDETINVNHKDVFLYSDYYNANETRSYAKQCKWLISAPENGYVSVLQLLYMNMFEGETLQIIGSINGTNTTTVYNNLSEVNSVITYYDGPIQINYIRSVPVHADKPAFRLMIRSVKVVTRNCSLGYNNLTYFENGGMFTNDVPGEKYLANEDCLWHLYVPENRTAEFCCSNCQYGSLSGDSLVLYLANESILECATNKCVTLNNTDEPYVVDFVWQSDGTSEYNGFTVTYELFDIYSNTQKPSHSATDACRTSLILLLLALILCSYL